METVSGGDTPDSNPLLRAWQELDVPEGWRAEIIDGEIRLMTPPSRPHNFIAAKVSRALLRSIPETWDVYQTLGLRIDSLGDLYVPDLVVIPDSAMLDDGADLPCSAEDALLVVEIVSKSNGDRDRRTKLRGYAHGLVPLYLLVDRWAEEGPSVTLYEDPENGRYRRHTTVPFGAKASLPSPFGLELDTSDFPDAKQWK
ncbi:Uma2 family endonuclease [Actinorugispora endophytica]|nr:Uma2 family endonuclease [Actinorugispora endophytica]